MAAAVRNSGCAEQPSCARGVSTHRMGLGGGGGGRGGGGGGGGGGAGFSDCWILF